MRVSFLLTHNASATRDLMDSFWMDCGLKRTRIKLAECPQWVEACLQKLENLAMSVAEQVIPCLWHHRPPGESFSWKGHWLMIWRGKEDGRTGSDQEVFLSLWRGNKYPNNVTGTGIWTLEELFTQTPSPFNSHPYTQKDDPSYASCLLAFLQQLTPACNVGVQYCKVTSAPPRIDRIPLVTARICTADYAKHHCTGTNAVLVM